MKIYKVKSQVIKGTDYREVYKRVRLFYDQIKTKTKRKPYVRSAYFKKEKVFLDLFWSHLHDKENFKDKLRRLKLFLCAIELIKNTKLEPISRKNQNKSNEILHRFVGITNLNESFTVQIKESKNNRKKRFISVFPN